MALARFWKRHHFGPDEVIHALKRRGDTTFVCEIKPVLFDGYVARSVRNTARHQFGELLKDITCNSCRLRLELPCL